MELNSIYFALAGLIHDIGKFYQRSFEKIEKFDKKEYRYSHAYCTHRFLNDFLGNFDLFSDFLNILKDSALHHIDNPDYPVNIIQKADYLSASEREKERKEEDEKTLREKRLHPVFVRFSEEEKNYFYDLVPLILDEEKIFPKNEITETYKSLWEKFENEIKNLTSSLKGNYSANDLKNPEILEKIFNIFYFLLYKYTWCVPSDTYSKEKKAKQYSDISLFDHSRITSAFSSCLVKYLNKSGNIENPQFCLLKVDFSGIQKFLFSVKSGEGGIAKRLRGRSFFLTILPEFISRILVNKLGYTISNILFCGGGNFELLITKKDIEKAKEFLNSVEEFLFKEFEGELGLIYEYVVFSDNDIENDKFYEINKELGRKLAIKKYKKIQNLIFENRINSLLNENFKKLSNKKLCKTCGKYFTENENSTCKWCEIFFKIGELLPKIKTIIYSYNKLDRDFFEIKIGEFGYIYLAKESLENFDLWNKVIDIFEIISSKNEIELKKGSTGFKFLAQSMPLKNKSIITFEELADRSTGDKKLGVLKMDVDNLSMIFNNREIFSFSRKATLSRMLDLFFSGLINEICRENGENNYHYILYSGGDDLFIISSWDKAIEIANKINEKFRKFTISKSFTLSAGLSIVHKKYPVSAFSELVDEAEKYAKDKGKNKICVFNTLIEWDDLKKLNDFSDTIIEYIDKKKIRRTLIYRILILLKQYAIIREKEFVKVDKNPKAMFYPLMLYYLKRNFYGTDEELEYILNGILNNYFENLFYVINFILTKTREVR